MPRRANPTRPLLLFLALALGAAGRAPAATYVVSAASGASDAAPGTAEQPWATLQHAASQVGPGDTVLVRGGDHAGFHLTTSGTAGAPITFRAWPGETPRIVADNPVTPDGINLEGASWVVIEGFRVEGRGRAGIRAVLCERVTIRGNDLVGNTDWGVLTGFCDDLLIEGNVAADSDCEHGIYVSNSGDRPVIRGNLVHGNHGNGIHMNGDVFTQPPGGGADGIISGALVEGNVIFDNGAGTTSGCKGGGSGINMDGVQDSVIRNNLIFAAHQTGISLYEIDGGGPSTGNLVAHNTVVTATDGRWGLLLKDGATGNTVRGNVLWSEHSYRGAITASPDSLPGLVSDHNVVEGRFTLDGGDSILDLAEWRAATGQDLSSVVAAPAALFADPAAGDFHLLAGSAAVDLVPLGGALEDLDGTPRPLGPAGDAGAFEGVGVVFADGFERGGAGRWSAAIP